MACAVGATSVEGAEAANAIPTWDALQERVQEGHCVSAAQSLSCVSDFLMLVTLSYPCHTCRLKLVHAGATYGMDRSSPDTGGGSL